MGAIQEINKEIENLKRQQNEVAYKIEQLETAKSVLMDGKPNGARKVARSKARSAKRPGPAHCIYPNCKKPHKGPRFSYLCVNHMGISKAEKKKVRAKYDEAQKSK